MKKNVVGMMGLVLVLWASSVMATQIDLTSEGVTTYGHCYAGWGNPRSFSDTDTYVLSDIVIGLSNDGYSLAVNPGTTAGAPGYAIYKFVAPAGDTISNIDLFVNNYYNNGSGAGKMDVYYSTAFSGTGTPDFGTWTNLNYGYQQWGYSQTMTFAPQANAVYVAYVGWNGGGANWELQVTQDRADITVVPEPATLSLLVMGLIGFIGRRK
jgi:hypothetical protein